MVHNRGHEHRRYRCGRDRLLPAAERHGGTTCNTPKLDDMLWAWVEWLLAEDVLAEAMRQHRRRLAREQRTGQQAALRERLRETEAAIERNLAAYRAGGMDTDMLAAENRPLLAQRDRLRAQVDAEADDSSVMQISAALRGKRPAEYLRALRERPADVQLLFLRALVERVEVWRDRIRIIPALEALEPVTLRLPRYYSPARGHTLDASAIEEYGEP